jgi:catechol 2,3-dioxygenase-like lactoylglutathione lyase family enzyme
MAQEPNADDRRLPIAGINHLALVCSDMARTVEFYTQVMGFPLIKTVELPAGMGQHFFFDIGGGNSLAFFWFDKAPAAAPGVAAPAARPDTGDLESAIGSMNHVSFNVPQERIEEIRQTLIDRGVECSKLVLHDDSEWTVTNTMNESAFVSSVYFFDPDGILLELSAWLRPLTEADVKHVPMTARGLAATN